MKVLRNVFRFCSNSNSLNRNQYFTQIQCKELLAKQNPLRGALLEHINNFGQLQIERYWKSALTDPQFGYYATKNVFSKTGDFTTSPEISPLFGQMFGVWIAYFLKKTKIFNDETQQVEKKFRIVQLGGGRGLFIKDIIRSLNDFKISNNFDLSFIEMSEYNRKAQQDSIIEYFKERQHYFKYEHEKSNEKFERFSSQNQDKNVSITWHETIQELYKMDIETQKTGQQIPFTIFIMNEFMDALPTTILRYTEAGWKEKVLVKSKNQDLFFQLKESKNDLAEKLTPITPTPTIGQQIQISPTSLLTIDLLAKIIEKTGGAIVNIDYGDQGTFGDSIRAIKQHKFIPSPYFWQIPGQCDLSAYVNFRALAQFAEKTKGIIAYQVVPQGYFLEAMGIVPRIDILKKTMNQESQKRIQSQYERLVLPSQMGQIYKVQIITKKQYGDIYPFIQVDDYSF